ncbi:MAG: stalk domain-containing protein, partial [Lachnospiraceae bacterium]
LNGILLENAEAVIIDGTTYLPLRALCEAMNMSVEWKEETREVFVTYEQEFLNSPGVKALDENVQKQLKAYMTTNLPNGKAFRSHLEETLKGDYYSLTQNEQRDAIKTLMDTPIYYQVPFSRGAVPIEKADYTYKLKEYDNSYDVWRGEYKPVWKYEIEMEGKEDKKHIWQFISTVENTEIVEEIVGAIAFFPYPERQYLKRLIYIPEGVNTCYGGSNTIWVKIDYNPTDFYLYTSLTNCMGYLLRAEHPDISAQWTTAYSESVIPVSKYGNTSVALDFGEFARLYFSVENDKKLLEELETVYPKRFRIFAALLYEADSQYYSQYYVHNQMVTNYKYTGEAQESFTVSIPGTKLYLTAPKEERLYPIFEEYTGADNQIWTRKIYDGHSVITAFNTDRCLYAVRPYNNPITNISTTVGGVMADYSYVIIGEDTIYFTNENGYLGTGEKQPLLSDNPVKLTITPVEKR